MTSEMLKGEEFRACFVKDLFEADDALKLFEKLYIVAPLNESEFIMPAMLQTVAEKDMERYVPAPSEHVAPLFLHFHAEGGNAEPIPPSQLLDTSARVSAQVHADMRVLVSLGKSL